MVEESSNNYLPSYSVHGGRLGGPLGDSPLEALEAPSVLSSEFEISIEDSSIHTSDYGSSSIDTSILHDESDMDTAFSTKFGYDRKKNESSSPSSRSKSESSRSSKGTGRDGSSTEESSSDWVDVSDSSSGSEGGHSSGNMKLEVARSKTRSTEGSKDKPMQLPEMPRRGRIRTFDTGSQSRLRHVDYLSQIDVASLGREQVSTEGPIRPMDAQSAFEREVPFEIPVFHRSREKDDISSIGAVSQTPKQTQDLKAKRDPLDLERGIKAIPSLETLQAFKEELSDAWGAPRRSELELFFIALIAISLVILVILLILLLSQR